MIEQFKIQPSEPPADVNMLAVALIVIGIISLVSWLLLWNYRFKHRPVFGGKIVGYGIGIDSKYGLAILGITLIVVGGLCYGLVFAVSSSPAVVTVGEGYINVKTGFAGVGNNKNATSEEIVTAFVGQLGSGNFSLHRQSGTSFGDTNIGRYMLGNGATAYIASTNSTNLIIELKDGTYIIVGNQDTQTIVNNFSQNVHSLVYDITYVEP